MATVTQTVKKNSTELLLTGYEFRKGMLGSQVVLRLPCMRKADKFEIYNFTEDSKYIEFQGNNKCFIMEVNTGRIVYSNKGNMPISYYCKCKSTHIYSNVVNGREFIKEVKEFVRADSRNKADGSTECIIFG